MILLLYSACRTPFVNVPVYGNTCLCYELPQKLKLYLYKKNSEVIFNIKIGKLNIFVYFGLSKTFYLSTVRT